MEILNYITSEVHKGFSPLFNPAITPEWKEATLTALGKKFDWLTGFLGSREYLLGSQFTVADAYLFTVLGWTKPLKSTFPGGRCSPPITHASRTGPKCRKLCRAKALVK